MIDVAFVVRREGVCVVCFSPLNGGAGGSKSEAKENLSASTSDQLSDHMGLVAIEADLDTP